MPQKRNPDAAELVRAKTGKINGDLIALLTVLKGLPLAYNKDMQEDKLPVFDAFEQLTLCLKVMQGMVEDFTPDKKALRAAAVCEAFVTKLSALYGQAWGVLRGVVERWRRLAHRLTSRLVVRQLVARPHTALTLTFESFAFKHGVPLVADLVFDVRNLPNPFYHPELRSLTGQDAAVVDFLKAAPTVAALIDDICQFIARWLPSYLAGNRQYLTVAIGCTGGQHRSVYVVEELARHFAAHAPIVRHRGLA
jgi:hypothetical protein